MGRKVVGNLTTVTSNLDNFMVGLLCCAYASTSTDQLELIQINYQRAEQLAAYLRLAAGNENFLGITRAKANFKSGQIPLGEAESAQILSNQLSSGLWGLYSTAMQVAGLIAGPERRLTDQGRALVAEMVTCMGEDQWQSFNVLAQSSQVSMTDVEALAFAFNRMLHNTQLRRAVVDALLNWQSAKPLQLELYSRATDYLSHFSGDIRVPVFCKWLQERTETSDALRETIIQIQSLEPLLVLAATLMEWLQGQKGSDRAALLDVLKPRLEGLSFSGVWQEVAKLPHRGFLSRLFESGNAHDADALISCVLEQNKLVMQQRGGAAWIEWRGDALRVRVANDRVSIPESLDLHCHRHDGWRNSYFISSFLQIARQAVK
ncbi:MULTISPECIES: hypothetical protein [unclassified Aeromonas]|uniref:hypothetical protein n=1 Tax=unclassified Aeromonas TaxID=257493 RepID=UPI0035270C6F